MRKMCVLFTVVLGLALLPSAASALSFKPAPGDPLAIAPPNDVITGVATGNFNGDIYDDIAAVGQSNKIYVWLTQADGTFQPAPGSPFGTGTSDTIERYRIFAAEMNGDFRDDLIVQSGQFPGTFHTYLGAGDGTFPSTPTGSWIINHTGAPNFRGAANFRSATVADLTGDGCADILVGMFERMYQVGISNCAGGFAPATPAPVPVSTPLSDSFDGFETTATGDYNGDGDMDIALMLRASSNSGEGRIVYTADGDGSGTFDNPVARYDAGVENNSSLTQIQTADLTGDDQDDLVIVRRNQNGSDTVATLVGSEAGLAANPSPAGTLAEPYRGIWSLGVADFDGDGSQDLGFALRGSREFGLALGDGAGGLTWYPNRWALAPIADVDFFPNDVELPDLNGDGYPDLVTSSSHSGQTFQARGIHALISSPSVSAAPTEIGFPETPVGEDETRTITITGGEGPSSVLGNSSFTVEGPGAAQFDLDNECFGALETGGTCDLNVTFDPDIDGAFEAAVKITVPGGNEISIPLSGVTGHESLTVNSPDGTQWDTPGGGPGGEKTFEIEADGTWPVKINDIQVYAELEEQDDRWGLIDTNNCKTTMQPGETCDVDVHFGPELGDTGSVLEAVLVIESDNPALTGPYADLAGHATTSAFEVTPLQLEFGDRALGSGASPVKTFAIEPTGDGPIPFYGVELQGDDNTSFSLAGAGNCPEMIPVDSSCTFEVAFDPKGDPGFKQTKVAVMAYNNNGGEYFVNVNGTATNAEPPPPPPDADLRLTVKSAKKVKAGKKLLVTATVRNVGDAATLNPVTLRAISPKKTTKSVKVQKIPSVSIGQTVTRKFRIPVKKNAKGRLRVKVDLTYIGHTTSRKSARTAPVKIQKRRR